MLLVKWDENVNAVEVFLLKSKQKIINFGTNPKDNNAEQLNERRSE
jgi:hypothetical protein